MSRLPRASAYALAGGFFALGAPLGLLVLRALRAGTVSPEWASNQLGGDGWTYAYVALSTVVAFTLFGRALGRQADRLYDLSSTDPLTLLRNRRGFEERLEEEFARATRYDTDLSLLLIDLDGLKDLNDRLGHRAGDEALREVASAIRTGPRAADVAGRWGGDEFALLAPNTGSEDAKLLGERIRAFAEGGEGARHVTVSVGVTTLDAKRRFASSEAMVRAADSALYEAKRRGRNCVASG